MAGIKSALFNVIQNEDGSYTTDRTDKQNDQALTNAKRYGTRVSNTMAEGNPVLNKYEKKVAAEKQNMKKGDWVNLNNPMSSRYAWKNEEGGPDSSSGMFLPREVRQAGISAKERNQEMDTSAISSTAIKRIRYNPESGNLYITYKSSKKGRPKEYVFPNVPKGTVTRLMNSFSKGTYTAKSIKPRYAVSKSEAIAAKQKDK